MASVEAVADNKSSSSGSMRVKTMTTTTTTRRAAVHHHDATADAGSSATRKPRQRQNLPYSSPPSSVSSDAKRAAGVEQAPRKQDNSKAANDNDDDPSGTDADSNTRAAAAGLVAVKSFLWCVVDRLDSCCSTTCGRTQDVLLHQLHSNNSPPTKEIHFSSALQPLQVTTDAQDVEHFALSGRSFRNDGTFPVSNHELLAARFHSYSIDDSSTDDDDSEQESFLMKHCNNSATVRRGALREYFAQCAADETSDQLSGGSTQEFCSSSHNSRQSSNGAVAHQELPCQISTTATTTTTGTNGGRPGLEPGRV